MPNPMSEGRRRTRRLFSRKTPSLPSSPQTQEDGRGSKHEKEKPHLTPFAP